MESSKAQQLFGTEILCKVINDLAVSFVTFYVSLLNKIVKNIYSF